MGEQLQDSIISAALARAMDAGAEVRGTTSPNPPVGAVIVSAAGEVVGVGATQPVGGAHAEVMALREAGDKARGATAVVTLEPCAHTGRTGPCAQALIDAGVAHVYYLHADPTPHAAGGARVLAEAGVGVGKLERPPHADDALAPWLFAVRSHRPHVTLKFAQTLDGFTAAADGTSQWITGESARDWVHSDRAHRDAIVVGTGTALADNPSLTARFSDGSLREHQPRRVIIGKRDLESAGDAASHLRELGYEQYDSIEKALFELYASGARDVLVEGGAGLASSFLKADLVDAISAYIAPLLLGEGRGVLAHPVTQTLSEATRFQRVRMKALGNDVLIEYVR
ncbi:bifunctional diaminohydroxyphosphoribosylaminopyrimidine deaminase/5-amino-6-(5-phosphoribosylamino)uracil reductase RibD [Corynebacterium yonathiae]|uniref:Riboflavin biosynthesis protein RibD n=1 Tax=Corynebacterium yonathiae TaxID=2913504 RepID=A0A9X3LYC2_9CORY|nr:bifunctional diaminohydroxyphosphoribosylaminopyrimidine deaminase/5-amino-6-(5-phosphoribosylamino)uracil reductase RibD [Corynebacterium sp. BWA136]MCZ9295088.1 bifunctional diaminohydroxyphosphoribosylaminopyrimidine deaminase/5-amino-6-(5-phosphoribosylamino)uracil reductase RibD [Corynebacterium yonathiae]MDK2582655.1 bifunctional diaminohydroxyphosphoribosylaminopyrimidine deaminase/5-amino-6-(5-phosphoribosylamino)uracil reductase RibD [Corynebacterium sp. BWA136]